MDINDLYWHDSTLLNIYIDRSVKRDVDSIVMEIDWHDIGIKKVIFRDVYWANLYLNMGVIGVESICNATMDEDKVKIVELKNRWKGYLDNMELHYFRIEFNSTGSTIEIISKSFKFVEE